MLVVYQIGAIDTIFCFQLRNMVWIVTDSASMSLNLLYL